MYLLDTNICIALMNGDRAVIGTFNRVFTRDFKNIPRLVLEDWLQL